MAIKKLLKNILPPFITHTYKNIKQSRNKYFSLNNLDKQIEHYLPEENGFFVELGANNGIDQSNTLYFERNKGWKGVLIEPVLHNYFKCKKNRSINNRIFCNACVSFEYKDRYVPIMYANLMTLPLFDSSDLNDKDQHLEDSKTFLEVDEGVIEFGALAKTLNNILIEANAPQIIDLLSLDVEGGEFEVLRGINFTQFSFKYMCIECRDIERLEEYLKKYDYKLIKQLSLHDYLFHKA